MRRWSMGWLAALPLAAFAAAQPIAIDPKDVFELVEAGPRPERAVRVEDARTAPLQVTEVLPNGVRLGDAQLRQSPPEALRQALESYVNSTRARARPRDLLTGGTVRLTLFDFRFVQRDLVAEGGRSGIPATDAFDFLVRSLAQSTAGGSLGMVRIEVEVDGRFYSGHGVGKFTATPSSVATRGTFQYAVDDLVKALSVDPAEAAAEAARPKTKATSGRRP